jgi:hypothetical protein
MLASFTISFVHVKNVSSRTSTHTMSLDHSDLDDLDIERKISPVSFFSLLIGKKYGLLD